MPEDPKEQARRLAVIKELGGTPSCFIIGEHHSSNPCPFGSMSPMDRHPKNSCLDTNYICDEIKPAPCRYCGLELSK